jgi:peptide/nickel transport system substrate-binding protein
MKQMGSTSKSPTPTRPSSSASGCPTANFDIANFAWGGQPVRDLGQPGQLPARQRQQLRPVLQQEGRPAVHPGHGELDEAKAADMGNQIDQQITADMATIPLYQKPTFIAYRNTFANIADNATPRAPSGTRTLGQKTA